MLFTELPVIEEQEAEVVLEGRTCEIVCSATGRPLPNISWRRVTSNDDYVTGIQPVRNKLSNNSTVFRYLSFFSECVIKVYQQRVVRSWLLLCVLLCVF